MKKSFFVYLLAFFITWTGWVYFVYPAMTNLGEATLVYALANVGLRLLIWVLPVFLYLHYIDRVDTIEYLKLTSSWKRGVLIGLLLGALNFAGTVARFGWPHPAWNHVSWNSILSTSIFIGFVEEIPFRGFILQKFQEQYNFWTANVISSLLFLGIHLPGWILLHMLNASAAISIFILAFVFAILFHYSRSLWSGIFAHDLNDFVSAVLFHR